MPFLIHETAEELYTSIGLEGFIANGSSMTDVSKDLFRTHFLGNTEQSKTHVKLWSHLTDEQAQFYTQGDMTAGGLRLLLNQQEALFPFKKADESVQEYRKHIHISNFAFVNDGSELCGLILCFRKDDPSQWMIGLVKNTQFKPVDRSVTLLTSKDLKPSFKSSKKGINSKPVDPLYNQLIHQIDIPFLKVFLQKILNSNNGIIDIKSQRIDLLTRGLINNRQNGYLYDPINILALNIKLLLADNPCLDLILQHEIQLSSKILQELINPSSELYQVIAAIMLTGDSIQDKNKITLLIDLHEEQLLKKHQDFLNEKILSEDTDYLTSEKQIKIIPWLLKNNVSQDLILLLLSEPDYYQPMYYLSQALWSPEIIKCVQDINKLEELHFINTLQDNNAIQICLLFWVHGALSQDGYKELVQHIKENKLSHEVLAHLLQTATYSLEQLQVLCSDPLAFQKEAIYFQFVDLFQNFNLQKDSLKTLSLQELKDLNLCFNFLRASRIKHVELYKIAMAQDIQGQLLRLFLPDLLAIHDLSKRNTLLELLRIAIQDQDDKKRKVLIEQINDKQLLDLAKKMQQQLLVSKQLQYMDFTDHVLKLAHKDKAPNYSEYDEYPGLDFILRRCELHPNGEDLKRYLLGECLIEDSPLRKIIEILPFKNDIEINKSLLALVLVMHTENALQKHLPFLSKLFLRVLEGNSLHAEQIKLIPFLLNREYALNHIVKIIDNPIYCSAIYYLKQRGFTQNVGGFLEDPVKLKQLTLINDLQTENLKQLCWVIWAKSTALTWDQMQAIIKATEDYPLLTNTLLALDASQAYPIEQLHALALNPEKHMHLSVLHHFAPEFRAYQLKEKALKKFQGDALQDLVQCFKVLKKAGITEAKYYKLVLKNNNDGKLLRLFLPRLAEDYKDQDLVTLVQLIYEGTKKESVSQGRMVAALEEPKLKACSKRLYDQFICAKQLQRLNLAEELIRFAAQQNDPKAESFREIIISVEKLCEEIQERLRQSSDHSKEANLWRNADEEYRKKMYIIAFEKFQNHDIDYKSEIIQAENKLLAIVDPEIKSIVHKALIAIANILILILSLNFANRQKFKHTGNYWFFNQTPSGEQLRARDKSIIETLESKPQTGIAL